MKKEPVDSDDDKYFSYKNKRDSNGKLISYRAQKLSNQLTDLSLQLLNEYYTIKKIKKIYLNMKLL